MVEMPMLYTVVADCDCQLLKINATEFRSFLRSLPPSTRTKMSRWSENRAIQFDISHQTLLEHTRTLKRGHIPQTQGLMEEEKKLKEAALKKQLKPLNPVPSSTKIRSMHSKFLEFVPIENSLLAKDPEDEQKEAEEEGKNNEEEEDVDDTSEDEMDEDGHQTVEVQQQIELGFLNHLQTSSVGSQDESMQQQQQQQLFPVPRVSSSQRQRRKKAHKKLKQKPKPVIPRIVLPALEISHQLKNLSRDYFEAQAYHIHPQDKESVDRMIKKHVRQSTLLHARGDSSQSFLPHKKSIPELKPSLPRSSLCGSEGNSHKEVYSLKLQDLIG